MKIYDGGSDKDFMLSSMASDNPVLTHISSSSSQLFVAYNSKGNEVGKGFSVSIILGNIAKWN